MRLYVAVTDKDWFALHASKPEVEEVNFWRPSPDATFKVLQPGELLLFKLHSPDNFITGGGFFTRFLQLPVNLVWDTFGEANGVRSQFEMRERIAYYRRSQGPTLPLRRCELCPLAITASGEVSFSCCYSASVTGPSMR
jgi:putative restriction endonuclease